MSPHNRRAHARYQIHLNAELRVGDREFTAITRDLSEGGTCIEAAYGLPEGGEVEVALFVVVDGIEDASTPPLRTHALVQWCAENEDARPDARHLAGLRFDQLTDAQRSWLVGLIERVG